MFNLLYQVYKTAYRYFYPKRPSISPKLRKLVWEKTNHGEIGKCYCCDRQIDILNYHCAHVVSHKHGGKTTLNNLFATCAHCNLSCKTTNLYVFIKKKNLKGLGSKKLIT